MRRCIWANGSGIPFFQGSTSPSLTVPADPTGVTGSYALVQASGGLSIGSFDVTGSFYFLVSSSELELQFEATAALGPLGQANVDGDVVIEGGSAPGLYGILQASLASSPSIPDISFDLNLQFEINTTDATQTVTGFTDVEEEGVGLTKVVPFLVENEMLNLGATFAKVKDWGVYTVADGKLITGQNPASSGPAARLLVDTLNKKAK